MVFIKDRISFLFMIIVVCSICFFIIDSFTIYLLSSIFWNSVLEINTNLYCRIRDDVTRNNRTAFCSVVLSRLFYVTTAWLICYFFVFCLGQYVGSPQNKHTNQQSMVVVGLVALRGDAAAAAETRQRLNL